MKTQLTRVVEILESKGEISRNECLGMYPSITRLSGIIYRLEKEYGFIFNNPSRHDSNYWYVVVKLGNEILEKRRSEASFREAVKKADSKAISHQSRLTPIANYLQTTPSMFTMRTEDPSFSPPFS